MTQTRRSLFKQGAFAAAAAAALPGSASAGPDAPGPSPEADELHAAIVRINNRAVYNLEVRAGP